MSSEHQPITIAVLISGGGTTLKNLIDYQRAGKLAVDIRLVITSNPEAGGLTFASDANIPAKCIERRNFESAEDFSSAIFTACDEAGVDLVVMGGFLKHALIPDRYAGRVINIHPSLIPSFSGKGFYGAKVHQAVIDYGCKLSGCTVHFVDNQYDHGPIIAQRAVEVLPEDTAKSLAARVFEQECIIFPEVIQAIGNGQIRLEGRTVYADLGCSQ